MARTLCVLAAVAVLCVCVASVSAEEPVMAPVPVQAVAAVPGAPCPCGVPAGMNCVACVRRCYAPVYCGPVYAPICAPAYPCGYPVYRVYRPWPRPLFWGGYYAAPYCF